MDATNCIEILWRVRHLFRASWWVRGFEFVGRREHYAMVGQSRCAVETKKFTVLLNYASELTAALVTLSSTECRRSTRVFVLGGTRQDKLCLRWLRWQV